MAWKGVHLSRASPLSLADAHIVVEQNEGTVRLPLEDVAWIIVDTPQATLTTALLAACMDAGIAVIITDGRHQPCGMALPFHRHHRQAAVANIQLSASTPLKKRLWQSIVCTKIENQASALDACSRPGAGPLRAMAEHVGSGDPENIEARAARHYWGHLFDRFVRGDASDLRNKMLDYGYAIVRASIARSLVAGGFLPCFGIQHASATNAFNLSDDLIEPFRPFVDVLAYSLALNNERPQSTNLALEDRRCLANILTADTCINGEWVTLHIACEISACSLARAIEAKSTKLLHLPLLIVKK